MHIMVQERVQNRTVEQIVAMLVSQIQQKLVEVTQPLLQEQTIEVLKVIP